MKFGLFYQIQVPKPWDEESEARRIWEALDQIAYAEEMGYDSVWFSEHHFRPVWSHNSAPDLTLAAVSQRTQNIRLGHGIIQTAPAYNHPARTAERIATLDLVSNGRVDFGSGESSSAAELGGFNIDPAQKREAWRDLLAIKARLLGET